MKDQRLTIQEMEQWISLTERMIAVMKERLGEDSVTAEVLSRIAESQKDIIVDWV